MKCPRCLLAEIQGPECPVCHKVVKQRNPFWKLKAQCRDFGRVVWGYNVFLYERTKWMMLCVAVVMIGVVAALMLQTANFAVLGVAIWFGTMAALDFYKARMAKK